MSISHSEDFCRMMKADDLTMLIKAAEFCESVCLLGVGYVCCRYGRGFRMIPDPESIAREDIIPAIDAPSLFLLHPRP